MEQGIITGLADYSEIIAVLVLVAGFLAAQLARRICRRGLDALDQRIAQRSSTDSSYLSPDVIRATGAIVFWLVMAIAVVIALRLLGVGGLSGVHEDLVSFIPRLVVGVAIIGAGQLIGLLSRGLIAGMREDIQTDSLLPRIVHASILVVAVVMGLQQMSIDISFLTQLLIILLAIGSGALALAFALGARQHVANLIARSDLQRYTVGERIRIEEEEGTIVEIHATGLDIATASGIVSVPAAKFSEVAVLTFSEEDELTERDEVNRYD